MTTSLLLNNLLRSLRNQPGLNLTTLTELPLTPEIKKMGCDRSILFNISIEMFKDSNPQAQLSTCTQIATQFLQFISRYDKIQSWAIGFSIFIPPWNQSSRAYCGWILGSELVKTVNNPLICVRNRYSSVKEISNILALSDYGSDKKQTNS